MPSPYVKDKYDFGILRTDGTTKVGMMLMRGKGDVPAYQVFDDEYLASQFFSGTPGYASLPAEKELALRQESWRAGFGLEVFDSADPERYRTSNGMDLRFLNMAIAGPKTTAVTKPTIATGWLTPNGFEDSAATWTDEALAYDGDTATFAYSASIAQDVWTDPLIIKSSNAAYCDSVRVWVNATNGTVEEINLDAWYDGAWNDITQATITKGQWVTITLPATKWVYKVRIYLRETNSGGSAVHRVMEVNFNRVTASNGVTFCHADFNNAHYVTFGNILGKLNGTGTAFTYVTAFTATITALEVFGSNLFIALNTTDKYWYMNTSEVFTETTAAVTGFKYLKLVDAATPVLWGSDSANTIRSNTNPVNGGAAWSGTTTIASSWDDITGLFSDAGLLYITKEDMPYYLNSAGAVQNDLANILSVFARSTDNGKGSAYWLGKFYLPWDKALLEEDGGTLTWRNPGDSSTRLGDFVGQVFAVSGDDRYLFAIIDNSTKIEVLAGRLESIGGSTRWVWHPINETTLTGCESCWVSSIYQKRLWISSTSSSDSLYYMPLPVAYGNVTSDANRDFLTGVTFETSLLHGNFLDSTKAYIELTLKMGHTYNANVYFTVKYQLLEDTAWTTIGNFTGSATSMIQSRYIPVDAESNNPKSTLFKLQFTAVTNDVTITPVLLSYKIKAVLYPDQREIIACKVYCANEILLRDGSFDKGSYDTIIATLNEARTSTYPVTIYDINGDTQTGKFLPLSGIPRWSVIKEEQGRKLELEYNLLFQKITIS